jgi:hypothetical protein
MTSWAPSVSQMGKGATKESGVELLLIALSCWTPQSCLIIMPSIRQNEGRIQESGTEALLIASSC